VELKQVMSLILPKGLEEYFELVEIKETEECLILCLDERNIPPIAYKNVKTISKGFFEPSSIRDFPLRGKSCFLNVRRCK